MLVCGFSFYAHACVSIKYQPDKMSPIRKEKYREEKEREKSLGLLNEYYSQEAGWDALIIVYFILISN